jgi:hypothetical protein
MHNSLNAVAALALVLAGPAVAQTASQNAQPAALNASVTAQSGGNAGIGFLSNQTPDEWRGTNLIGANVYGPDDKPIGAINELVVGSNGDVRAVVIGVGGFLGIGEKNVAIPFRSLKIARKPNASNVEKVTIAATKEQLQQAPKFVYLEANGTNNTAAGTRPAQPKPATNASGAGANGSSGPGR